MLAGGCLQQPCQYVEFTNESDVPLLLRQIPPYIWYFAFLFSCGRPGYSPNPLSQPVGVVVLVSTCLTHNTRSWFFALQFSFLLDDLGVPLNYRHMEGFGVHTFMLLNAAGKETLVKFHWKPTCGETRTMHEYCIVAPGAWPLGLI